MSHRHGAKVRLVANQILINFEADEMQSIPLRPSRVQVLAGHALCCIRATIALLPKASHCTTLIYPIYIRELSVDTSMLASFTSVCRLFTLADTAVSVAPEHAI
jgi:prepilin signal peptidase PulO-like enzyme (type II secretory pathway)